MSSWSESENRRMEVDDVKRNGLDLSKNSDFTLVIMGNH